MANVTVQRAAKVADNAGLLADIERVSDRIREKAYEIFTQNGHAGHDWEDWFQAERELLWEPKAELSESDNSVDVLIAVPGMNESDIKVTALPDQIVVSGRSQRSEERDGKNVHFSEFSSRELFRRFDLPAMVNVDKVAAKLDKGVLMITAPKAAQTEKAVAASSATV
jgi:HSP20 family protein